MTIERQDETEARRLLYVIDCDWLEVNEYEIVKETPGRYQCKMAGPYDVLCRFDKEGRYGPNERLFIDPVEAIRTLDDLIAKKIGNLQKKQQDLAKQRQAIVAPRPEQNEQQTPDRMEVSQ